MTDSRPLGGGWYDSSSDSRPLGAARYTSSAPRSPTVASDHGATGQNVRGRMKFLRKKLKPQLNLVEMTQDFLVALDCNYKDKDTTEMTTALKKVYPRGNKAGEVEFDITLFTCFCNFIQNIDNEAKIVEYTARDGNQNVPGTIITGCRWKDTSTVNHREYAIGFKRQLTNADLEIPDDFCIAHQTIHDHACVLLVKSPENTWGVTSASALVELKTDDSTCVLQELVEGIVVQVDLPHRDSAVAQSLGYCASDIWTSMARCGIGRIGGEIPHSLRFAIIACRVQRKERSQQNTKKTKYTTKKPSSKKSSATNPANNKKIRWALCDLHVPKLCAEKAEFSIHSLGRFGDSRSLDDDPSSSDDDSSSSDDDSSSTDDDSSSTDGALAGYLHVMTQGILLLKSIKGKSHPAYQMSGRHLFSKTHNFVFESAPYTGDKWGSSINQGELWKGNLTPGIIPEDDAHWLYFDNKSIEATTPSAVLVKVSSVSFYNNLFDPNMAFFALRTAMGVKDIIKDVLIACNDRSGGLLTIMHDLKKQGYCDLRLSKLLLEGSMSLMDLWRAFSNLVKEKLLPLARLGLIHADLRPGFDLTGNIMVQVKGHNTTTPAASAPTGDFNSRSEDSHVDLKIVDYESIYLCEKYEQIYDKNGRYLDHVEDPFTFLCRQCYVAAVIWTNGYLQVTEEVDQQPSFIAWKAENINAVNGTTEANVVDLLNQIQRMIDKNEKVTYDSIQGD